MEFSFVFDLVPSFALCTQILSYNYGTSFPPNIFRLPNWFIWYWCSYFCAVRQTITFQFYQVYQIWRPNWTRLGQKVTNLGLFKIILWKYISTIVTTCYHQEPSSTLLLSNSSSQNTYQEEIKVLEIKPQYFTITYKNLNNSRSLNRSTLCNINEVGDLQKTV